MIAAASIPLLIVATGHPTGFDRSIISTANWVVWGVFTANFLCRVYLSPHRVAEARSLVWDIVIIVGQPLLALAGGVFGSATALVRLVVVIFRSVGRGSLLRRTLRTVSEQPLRVVVTALPLLWLTSAALLLRAEGGRGNIKSIGDALWWGAATMTTVGYGDLAPRTAAGRLVAVGTMVVGIGMFSVGTAKLAELLLVRRTFGPRGDVLESDHTLILGWSPKVFVLIDQLLIANASRKHSTVVVLAPLDRNEMAHEIGIHVPDLARSTMSVICRTGAPTEPAELAQVVPGKARAIVVLDDPDARADVVKSLLALFNGPDPPGDISVVAEVHDLGVAASLSAIFGDRLTVVDPLGFIARAAAQSCRIPGVALAYEHLLNFRGSEFYFREENAAVGHTMAQLRNAYSDACVVGLRRADGALTVNPPPDTTVAAGDQLVLVAEDDVTMTWVGASDRPLPVIAPAAPAVVGPPEEIWLFGWNRLGSLVVRDLDEYVPPGSRIVVAVEPARHADTRTVPTTLRHASIEVRVAEGKEHADMVQGAAATCHHALVLCETNGHQRASDPRALLTTLQLRHALRSEGRDVNVVTELRDERDVDLIPRTSAADFIVSERLASLLLGQLLENPHLSALYDDLFDPDGSELYCKAAAHYALAGATVTFEDITDAAVARGEVAIGYRHVDAPSDGVGFGLVINPPRTEPLVLGPHDQIVVLADNEWGL